MSDDERKLSNLAQALWKDAEQEARELRVLLASAQEDVCSLTCRSYFPPGHVRSEADHSEKCRAISAALHSPSQENEQGESK